MRERGSGPLHRTRYQRKRVIQVPAAFAGTKEDPPTKRKKGKKVDLADCDHCSKWTHLDCTKNWRNLCKNYWLCEAHK